MPNPRRCASSWLGLLELVWPSIRTAWKRAVAIERRRAEEDAGQQHPWPQAMWQWALQEGWDLTRWAPPAKVLVADVRVPGGRRLKKAGLALIDPGGSDAGAAELHQFLRETLADMANPVSGSLEIRLSGLDNREDAVKWRRRICVGNVAAPAPAPATKTAPLDGKE